MAPRKTPDEENAGERAEGADAERAARIAELVLRRSALSESEASLLREIFPALLRAHHKQLWNQLRRKCLQTSDVEDLIQDSLLELYKSILAGGFPANVPGMLRTITARQFWEHVQEKKTDPASVGLPSSSGLQAPGSAPDLARAVDLRTLAQEILKKLSPEHYDVIDKVVLCDLSHQEAAIALELAEGTLKSRLRAAMDKLITLTEAFLPESERGTK